MYACVLHEVQILQNHQCTSYDNTAESLMYLQRKYCRIIDVLEVPRMPNHRYTYSTNTADSAMYQLKVQTDQAAYGFNHETNIYISHMSSVQFWF